MGKGFRLQPLLRFRNQQLDVARTELAIAERNLARQLEELAILAAAEERALDALGAVLKTDVVGFDKVLSRRRDVEVLQAMMRRAEEAALALRQEVDDKRQVVVQAQQQMKVLERLQDRCLAREAQEERRKELKMNDELATAKAALRRRKA